MEDYRNNHLKKFALHQRPASQLDFSLFTDGGVKQMSSASMESILVKTSPTDNVYTAYSDNANNGTLTIKRREEGILTDIWSDVSSVNITTERVKEIEMDFIQGRVPNLTGDNILAILPQSNDVYNSVFKFFIITLIF